MKKNKMIVAVIFIFALLTAVFAMSNDGNNEPAKDSQQVKQVEQNIQVEQPVQPDQTKSNETVKDNLGIDTGMTKEELSKFKEEYIKLEKQIYPYYNIGDWFYNLKIDLNKRYELEKVGVDLNRAGVPAEAKTYKENSLYSDIIIIGSIVGEEQPVGTDRMAYAIKIDEVLKGENILINKLGKVPEKLHFFHRKGVMDGDNQKIIQNQKGIYFMDRADGMNKSRQWLSKVPYSTLLYMDGVQMVYEKNIDMYEALKEMEKTPSKYPDDHWITVKKNNSIERMRNNLKNYESWEETVANIKKILEINDNENFYNKKFRVKE